MKKSRPVRIACVGSGKMGEALVRGLLKSGAFGPDRIRAADRDAGRRAVMEKACGVSTFGDSSEAVRGADLVLLAVKPQDMETALGEIAGALSPDAVVVSIAAGISTDWIRQRLGGHAKVARAMPNAAALVCKSTTGLYCCPEVEEAERDEVRKIFAAVGACVVVDKEDDLNIVTGLSGSGPAYVFLLMETLAEAGVTLGLSRAVSVELALHTVLGSAHLALESGMSFAALREMISSPAGTTLAALKVLEEGAFRGLFLRAVEAATIRSRQLAR